MSEKVREMRANFGIAVSTVAFGDVGWNRGSGMESVTANWKTHFCGSKILRELRSLQIAFVRWIGLACSTVMPKRSIR